MVLNLLLVFAGFLALVMVFYGAVYLAAKMGLIEEDEEEYWG